MVGAGARFMEDMAHLGAGLPVAITLAGWYSVIGGRDLTCGDANVCRSMNDIAFITVAAAM